MDKKNFPVMVKLADYNPVSSVEKTDSKGWVKFGADNLFPQYLRELAETSPVHGSLCISIGDMIAGKGLTSNRQDIVDRLSCDKVEYGCAHDLKKYGGYYIEVIYTTDKTQYAKLNHIPYEEVRIAVSGEDDTVIGAFHSNDWSQPNKKKNKPTFIPKFNSLKPEEGRQIFWYFNFTSGQVYPRPDYWSSINYVELAKQIGIYHVNNIMNGLFPSFIVNFFNGQLSPEAARQAMLEWEQKLSGARNAGKFIMTFNERETQKPDVIPFPISDADKQYQFLSELSTTEVMISHRVTTPLLFGIRSQTGFGSNKDEMAIGLEIFTKQVIEPAQRTISNSFEEILSFESENITISIVPNTPLAQTATVEPTSNTTENVDVAAQALNGAQLDSLVQVILQVSAGALPVASGKAIVAAGFPTLTKEQIDNIFDSLVIGAVSKEQVLSKAPQMTTEDEEVWLSRLKDVGEVIDLDEWQLLSEDEAGTSEQELEKYNQITSLQLAYEQYDNSGDKSKFGDKGMYKLRYAYSTNLSDDTRSFCRAMAMDSMLGRVYRYEDIVKMSEDGVNGEFAERGQTTYDIFTWKGGCYCHHKWLRRIYFRKRDGGKFLPNDGLKNDIRVGNNPFVPKKGKEGIAPIDTPSRGKVN